MTIEPALISAVAAAGTCSLAIAGGLIAGIRAIYNKVSSIEGQLQEHREEYITRLTRLETLVKANGNSH